MGAYSVNSAENHRYFRSKVNLRDSDVDPRFNLVPAAMLGCAQKSAAVRALTKFTHCDTI